MKRVAVGLGIDRDRGNAHAPRCLDDPAGDLAAIGNQDSLEHVTMNPASDFLWCGFALDQST
jgi:hypothetical protein